MGPLYILPTNAKAKNNHKNNKKCLWNTTSPIMANSKDQKTNILKPV